MKNYHLKITTKLLLLISICIVTVYVLFFLTEYEFQKQSWEKSIKKSIESTQSEITSNSQLIKNQINTTSLLINALIRQDYVTIKDKETLIKLCQETPWLFGIGFMPIPYNKKYDFFVYFNKDTGKSEEMEAAPTYTKENETYSNQLWYTEPLKSGKGYFDKPGISKSLHNDKYLISYSVPVRDLTSQKIIGIEILDLDISWFNNFNSEFLHNMSIDSYLIRKDGVFLINRDKETISKKDKNIIKSVIDNLPNNIKYKDFNKNDNSPLIVYSDPTTYTYVIPLFSSQAILFCFFNKAKAFDSFYQNQAFIVFLLLLIVPVFILIILKILESNLDPISKISSYLKSLAFEENVENFKCKINSKEVEILKKSADILRKNLTEYARTLKLNTLLEAEMDLSKEVYLNFMPQIQISENSNIAFKLLPSSKVGGDFYNFRKINDDVIYISIGDIAGKGFSASLWTIMALMTESLSLDQFKSLTSHVKYFNNLIIKCNKSNMHLTFFCCTINTKNGELKYISCGHPMPYIITENNVFILERNKCLPIGIMGNFSCVEKSIQLKHGDKILIYTDGLSDIRNEKDEAISKEVIIEKLSSSYTSTPTETIDNLVETIYNYQGSSLQFDDICMVCYKF